jgi:hypothetical protein
MMVLVILGIAAAWLVLSVLASLVIAALGRGGLREDRSRGYLVDRY